MKESIADAKRQLRSYGHPVGIRFTYRTPHKPYGDRGCVKAYLILQDLPHNSFTELNKNGDPIYTVGRFWLVTTARPGRKPGWVLEMKYIPT